MAGPRTATADGAGAPVSIAPSSQAGRRGRPLSDVRDASTADASRPPARHELPRIDEAALEAARLADRLLDAARGRGDRALGGVPRPVAGTAARRGTGRAAQRRRCAARAAFGRVTRSGTRFADDLTLPFLAALDRLLKVLARYRMRAD